MPEGRFLPRFLRPVPRSAPMVFTLLTLGALCAAPASAPLPIRAQSDSLGALFQHGKTWTEFFEGAKSRKETWRDNYANGEPAAELVERARAVDGTWQVLVVAEDWCGDSANTIPYLVRLVEQVPGLELRIVNSSVGRWVMERYKTPDGRAATPTVVLLDAEGTPNGCFVERPAGLRAWVAENKGKLSDSEFQSGKTAWYQNDRGHSTVTEFVETLESASRGELRCAGPA